MTDETTTEIMDATYRALCECGYAALRMQDIADKTTKSTGTLHYHYDSTPDLLLAFLDQLYDQFVKNKCAVEGETPDKQLINLIDQWLAPSEDHTDRQFQTAILEIKSQAPYDEAYRQQLARFDPAMADRIRKILANRIERGVFAPERDPDRTADLFVTMINGAQTRHIAVNYSITATRTYLLDYIDVLAGTPPEVAAE